MNIRGLIIGLGLGCLAGAASVSAQSLRFGNHQDVGTPPEYANLRVGPFYSSLTFSQSFGYRYTKSEGTGTDFLFGNSRGTILEDGSDFPLISKITSRNFLPISRTTSFEASFSAEYYHYPMDTQEDDFIFDIGEEGIFGAFSFEWQPTDTLAFTIYDNPSLAIDYIDARGLFDDYGGQKYDRFENELGIRGDWNIAKSHNITMDFERFDLKPLDDEFNDQERVTYSAGLGLQRLIEPWGVLGLSLSAQDNEYTASDRPPSDSWAISGYGDFDLTDMTFLGLSAGYYDGTAEGSGDSGESGGSGSVRLNSQLNKNWSHSLDASRSLELGFESAFELTDIFRYSVNYVSDFLSAQIYVAALDVTPSEEEVAGYSDLTYGVNGQYPLTKSFTLVGDLYLVERENDVPPGAEEDEEFPELSSDYDTLHASLGGNYAFYQNLSFYTGIHYADRDSEDPNLVFERFTYRAMFTYTYDF